MADTLVDDAYIEAKLTEALNVKYLDIRQVKRVFVHNGTTCDLVCIVTFDDATVDAYACNRNDEDEFAFVSIDGEDLITFPVVKLGAIQ